MMIDFPWQPIKYEGFGKKGIERREQGSLGKREPVEEE